MALTRKGKGKGKGQPARGMHVGRGPRTEPQANEQFNRPCSQARHHWQAPAKISKKLRCAFTGRWSLLSRAAFLE